MGWFNFKLTSADEHQADLTLMSPFSGTIIPLEDVPDVIFAEKIIGDGIAVKPTTGTLVAPCKCMIKEIFSTRHAVVLKSEQHDLEIFIHIGIDTVDLAGEGFFAKANEGDILMPGDPIIDFNIDAIKDRTKSLISPIVISSESMKSIKTLEKLSGSCQQGVSPILKIDFNKEADKSSK